mmetsp:Transcript_3607/g.9895  ORF Transcript_3607/g.9895 Transcript_3607/m.9895 type:complete len:113 (+) Transcript_3607:369-707(+)
MSALLNRTATCKGYVKLPPNLITPQLLGVLTPLKPVDAKKQRNFLILSRLSDSSICSQPVTCGNSTSELDGLESGLPLASSLMAVTLTGSGVRVRATSVCPMFVRSLETPGV